MFKHIYEYEVITGIGQLIMDMIMLFSSSKTSVCRMHFYHTDNDARIFGIKFTECFFLYVQLKTFFMQINYNCENWKLQTALV